MLRAILIILILALKTQASPTLDFNNKSGNNLSYLIKQPTGKKKIQLFMDNVLRQFDSSELLKIINHIPEDSLSTNEEIYLFLEKQFKSKKPWGYFLKKVSALRYQQAEISSEIRQIIPDGSSFETYVEIGTPGTYVQPLKKHFSFKHSIVINDASSPIDYVHGYSLNPFKKFKSYDQFIELNDYEPINDTDIPSNSVDLVTCVIGLHHIPKEKLDGFIKSIYRILKPGGFFVLRDHDTQNEDTKAIVQAAHTIYNILSPEVTLDEETNEYRNFQPLGYWIKALEDTGFKDHGSRILQDGDPTLNTLMLFEKPARNMKDIEQILAPNPHYKRDLTRTILSIPEWQNVLTAEEYVRFIYKAPFYEFPYLKAVESFWDVFGKSWNEARKHQSLWQVLSSDYTQMNLFIGIFMTAEYGLKALISAPIRFLVGGEEPRQIQLLVRDPSNQVSLIHKDTKVLRDFGVDSIKLIEVPRYLEFRKIIESLDKFNDIQIITIAGNNKIQFTLKYPITKKITFSELKGVKHAYDWNFPTLPEFQFAAVLVNTESLRDFIRFIKKNELDIFYIHDF